MTKFEWERQLKKGISGLPKAEQQRVLDYYNELFADKIDAGLREQYIISEFGNPYDVANKILVDFYNEGKENAEVDAYIYSGSDEIDDAFEEQTEAIVETPKRKTWAERREERREEKHAEHYEEHKERRDEHASEAYADKVEYDTADEDKSKKQNRGAKSASGLIAVLCVLVYFVLGACFNLWHPAWLIFLLVPCIVTLIEAINRRNWRVFAYPVFVTFTFLLIGFYTHRWHPAWVLFITIPVYYVLGNFITKNAKSDVQNVKKDRKPSRDDERNKKPEVKDVEVKTAKGNKESVASNVFSVIAKILMICCFIWVAVVVWSFVVGTFVGGIGLTIGGIVSFVSAFAGGSVDALILGAAFAQVGLGLICIFGMAALFKPCFNMCKSFIKTVKNSFSGKEKVK